MNEMAEASCCHFRKWTPWTPAFQGKSSEEFQSSQGPSRRLTSSFFLLIKGHLKKKEEKREK